MGPGLFRIRLRFYAVSLIAAAFSMGISVPSVSAFTLDVGFVITDKLGKPIQGARACFQEDANQCAESNALGRVALATAPVGTKADGQRMGGQGTEGISFSLRGGRLTLVSPIKQNARVERFDAAGRALGRPIAVVLQPGSNALDLPEGREGISAMRGAAEAGSARGGAPQGLLFFRVTVSGQSFAGKALTWSDRVDGASAPATGGSQAPRVAALAALGKVAASNLHAVILGKAGFYSVTYRPKTDHDTGVVIRLAVEGDSGIQYAGVIRGKVDSLDTAKHIINYTYKETRCNGSVMSTVEQHATLPFYTRENRWYFPAGNCQGVALGKDGDGIYGQWKTLGVRDLPAGLFPTACDPVKDSVVTGVLNLFFINEGGGWDIDLRADSLTIKIRRELCPGNQAVFDVNYYDGKEGRPLLAKNTCREVEFRNPSNEPGIYSFVTGSDSLRGVFTYKDKTCPTPGVSLAIDTNAPKACPEVKAMSLASDTTFQRCVHNTGFMPPNP
jgi:hypothetical protein